MGLEIKKMSGIVDRAAQIRQTIERKKHQIALFTEDIKLDAKDQSFTPEQYAAKIVALKNEIDALEVEYQNEISGAGKSNGQPVDLKPVMDKLNQLEERISKLETSSTSV